MRRGTREQGSSPCVICHKMITNSGFGRLSHMNAHVRRGEAIESQRWPHRDWIPAPPFTITGKNLKRETAQIMEEELWKAMRETGEWDKMQAKIKSSL